MPDPNTELYWLSRSLLGVDIYTNQSRGISNCLSSLGNYDGVAPIIPATDSLIQWDGQNAHCVKRENVQIVQTPQCFKKIIIGDGIFIHQF